MAIPEEIKRLKPTGFGSCEIHELQGGKYYYVYQTYSVYDSKRKSARKKTGKAIGRITLRNGFIPNTYGQSLMSPSPVIRLTEYGIYELFAQLSGDGILPVLQHHFPKDYQKIYTLAMLRLAHHCTSANAKRLFEHSIFKEIYPEMTLGERSCGTFMKQLGGQQDRMVSFMQEFVPEDATILFDGTNIFTSAADSYARKGYNHGKRRTTQINLLYLFTKESRTPCYYRLLPGNITDKSSFELAVRESGVHNVTVIGDKGFYSKKNSSYLDSVGLRYILPLQSNTKMIDNDFASLPGTGKFDGFFIYHDRPIWYTRKDVGNAEHYVYIFQDDEKKLLKEKQYLKKLAESFGGYSREAFETKTRVGMFAFYSNINTEAQDIYTSYKGRWEIENCFDYLKNTVRLGVCYQQTKEGMAAWAFLNHISLMLFYKLVQALGTQQLSLDYSPEDIIDIAKNVYWVKCGNAQPVISEITKHEVELLGKLGVDLSSPSLSF
jgi:transposase